MKLSEASASLQPKSSHFPQALGAFGAAPLVPRRLEAFLEFRSGGFEREEPEITLHPKP